MTLTQKENNLLQDLKTQEQLCIEKYSKYSSQASNPQLKTMLSQIAQVERQHLQTLDQIGSGTVPQMSGSSSQGTTTPSAQSNYAEADKQKDRFLLSRPADHRKARVLPVRHLYFRVQGHRGQKRAQSHPEGRAGAWGADLQLHVLQRHVQLKKGPANCRKTRNTFCGSSF
jgi:hypothetical protein